MNITKLKRLAVFAVTVCIASGLMASDDALLDLLFEKGVLAESEADDVASDLKKTPTLLTSAAEANVATISNLK